MSQNTDWAVPTVYSIILLFIGESCCALAELDWVYLNWLHLTFFLSIFNALANTASYTNYLARWITLFLFTFHVLLIAAPLTFQYNCVLYLIHWVQNKIGLANDILHTWVTQHNDDECRGDEDRDVALSVYMNSKANFGHGGIPYKVNTKIWVVAGTEL